MARYRVWQANLEVFLWPENWLEPELRDDKSPFFKEIESELLQSDITENSATTAVFNYLAKLEEVAKLEPCAIYHQEGDAQTGDVDHVIARTAGAHRKYYYRRYEFGSWTPWAQVTLDIEDNPVTLAVCQGRLLLFSLRIMKKGPDTAQGPKPQDGNLQNLKFPPDPLVTTQAMLCWSEYYNGKWQPTKTSDVNQPVTLASGTANNAFDRSKLRLGVNNEADVLRVIIFGDRGSSALASFRLYNTHSLPIDAELTELIPLTDTIFNDTRVLSSSNLQFSIDYKLGLDRTPRHADVLHVPLQVTTIEPLHPLQNVQDAPFFFEDSRCVFYVTTTENSKTMQHGDSFSMFLPAPRPTGDIPELVLRHDPRPQILSDRVDQIGDGRGFGLVDLSPMERFVSEDAYIRTGIGSSGTVHYGGLEIGPAGALSNQRLQQS